MENKEIVRWERHYSDGSVEYVEGEQANNFLDNLLKTGAYAPTGEEYLNLEPIEWTKANPQPAQPLPITTKSS